MSDNKLKVLYIGGHGRSGSTLLERLLGQIDNFVTVGELRHIWAQSFVENQLCGCGKHFKECDFWNAVCEQAFEGYENVPIKEIIAIKSSVDRIRHIPRMFSPWKVQNYEQLFSKYHQILIKLYSAIKRVSNKKIIVDASKDPSSAFFLSRLPEIDLYIVHLTRDSRAVGFSWQRKKIRPEIASEERYMATYTPHATALGWIYRNLLFQLLKYTSVRYQHIRYEDFVAQPIEIISSILDFVGEPQQKLDFVNRDQVFLRVNHTVAGNPFRFRQGMVELRLDDEWQYKMKPRDKLLITLLTFPLLFKYKYSIFPHLVDFFKRKHV